MAFYRAIWLSVTGVLVLAGVAAAIVSPPWQGLLGLALLAVFVGPFIGAAIHPQFYENTAIPIYLLQATTVAIVGTIAAAGLIALSTVIALPHRPAAHRLSDQRLYLVELRSALLNELAQRNPQGFTLWLNSGAHAASDPARYFSSVHYSPHSAPTAPTSRPSNVIRR